jgi:hypothetical protein
MGGLAGASDCIASVSASVSSRGAFLRIDDGALAAGSVLTVVLSAVPESGSSSASALLQVDLLAGPDPRWAQGGGPSASRNGSAPDLLVRVGSWSLGADDAANGTRALYALPAGISLSLAYAVKIRSRDGAFYALASPLFQNATWTAAFPVSIAPIEVAVSAFALYVMHSHEKEVLPNGNF